MGAPKQKWTQEEETALKAGVLKHGTGKWRTILSDPQFSSVLKSRSNVDLKDKWRNINVTALWGSRKKAKLARYSGLTQDINAAAALTIASLAIDNDGRQQQQINALSSPQPQRDLNRTSVDKIILEAITNLKRPFGPDGRSILMYIEEHYKMIPGLKRLANIRIKYLTNVRTLIKRKQRYSISKHYMDEEVRQELSLEHSKDNILKPIDNVMIKGMTEKEAAAAAARAVAEAEFAMAEAEEAAREALEAEAVAEATLMIAKAAMKALKYKMHSQTRH